MLKVNETMFHKKYYTYTILFCFKVIKFIFVFRKIVIMLGLFIKQVFQEEKKKR